MWSFQEIDLTKRLTIAATAKYFVEKGGGGGEGRRGRDAYRGNRRTFVVEGLGQGASVVDRIFQACDGTVSKGEAETFKRCS